MKPFMLIPVKPLEEGKSRLSELLSKEKRAELSFRLFNTVLDAAIEAVKPDNIIVVSRDLDVLSTAEERGTRYWDKEKGRDLNKALSDAIPVSADSIIALHADLPRVSSDDIRAIIETGRKSPIVLTSDRMGLGTNAIFMRPPKLINFYFGDMSFSKHVKEARRVGVTPKILKREGLEFDLDTPEDYLHLSRLSNSV